ncbi:galactosylgalactosylxylosylprotein 3-beta-glucuronosyltransferase P [Malaya genurostris]|uniref:galactosylgalactosylxylosylprotein 3-beta-glucuronosyltransferase P n=1 Tax=Malaya genurostris TaxID=325434 RepID=UPI0026F40738|nr:galactosylgalactosylxylosylprotein 3-beta-glucuronosyltransferase P [Malaya genurostris]XP_058454796.1 galactosylgalactosylxylosylprotein 3-beta-glucuronosyltransferase P [Malaya genurostris]XP_058454797.1 galactosylgalactosylxylosylprotein 3-beta-glucuronosyltransferase P [Malaya genurostris]XP_058454798.1 galactosylgalactosylxylosylprotein 3-beta-glucuronosyltransferase P [Malaya genurostris]
MIKSYKLYLTLLISSVFIILCQNQISIANFVSTSSAATAGSHVLAAGDPASAVAEALIDLSGDDRVPAIADKIRSRSLTFNDVRPGPGTKSTDRTTTTLGTSSSSSTSSTVSSTASSSTSTSTTTSTTTTAAPTTSDGSAHSEQSSSSNGIPLKFPVDTRLLPPLYIITPTYRRPEQLAEITRLGYTLKHVPNLFWLIVEDAESRTEAVTRLLKQINVPFVHLTAPMPAKYRKMKVKPRGVSNRNRGLKWIRANATEGVLYFADDDNTYNLEIFEQMRYIRKVGMWPVGLISKYGVSSPIVVNGSITGFYDGWIGGRKYPIDMAGFAVSVKFLLSRPKAEMPFKAGYEEDGFLRSLDPLDLKEIDLLAYNCTEILTWHTQSKKNPPALPLNLTKHGSTNLVKLTRTLV